MTVLACHILKHTTKPPELESVLTHEQTKSQYISKKEREGLSTGIREAGGKEKRSRPSIHAAIRSHLETRGYLRLKPKIKSGS